MTMSSFTTRDTVNLSQSRSPTIIAVSCLFGGLALLAVGSRFYARRVSKAGYAWDDWLAVVAVFFNTLMVVGVCFLAHYGMGQHIEEVEKDPSNLVKFGKAELAYSLCYPPSIAFAKLSILMLFKRIFGTGQNRGFLIAVWILTIMVALWLIALWLVTLLMCHPITTYWSLTDSCSPPRSISISTGTLDATLDVAIFILPLPVVWNLVLPIQRKVLLTGVFVIGLTATIIGIARIPLLFAENKGASSDDTTWNATTATILTVLEPTLAIICMCLPMSYHVQHGIVHSSWFGSLRSLVSHHSTTSITVQSYHGGSDSELKNYVPYRLGSNAMPTKDSEEQSRDAKQDNVDRLYDLDTQDSHQSKTLAASYTRDMV